MKFGLFYEHQLPRPYDDDTWGPDDEHKIMKDALDQIELADKLGFDYVFEVEHHFLEEYSHSSAPEIFLSAVSQRTKNIRLGHGICLMPPRYNHPARVAERISTLDLVSDGRVEFGTGESASEMELGGFGVPREEKKLQWEEATRECVKMMTQTPYPGYEGAYFGMPSRNVIPKPLQKPHPPLWVASSRRETTMVAARLGMGSLGFAFETPEEARERVEHYFELVRNECTPIGVAINPALAVLSSLSCFDTDDEAIEKGVEGTQFFSYSLGYYYSPLGAAHEPAKAHIYRRFRDTPEEQRMFGLGLGRAFENLARDASGDEEPTDEVARALWRAAKRGGCIGSPDFIRDTLVRYEESHLDLMIFVAQAGARKHEDIMDSIHRFGTKVLPEFKERHAQHERWRAEQLAGVQFEVNSSIDSQRIVRPVGRHATDGVHEKVERIKDERLRASLQQARAALRSGNHREAIQRSGEAYVELLRRKPELLEGEGLAPRMRIWMFPRLGAHLEVQDNRSLQMVFDREQFGFPEAVTYYEFAVDNLVREGV